MAAIAEWFIVGFSAAAQRHAIANFVGSTIGGGDRDPTADPERAPCFNIGVFDQNDGWFKGRFYWFPGLFVIDDEATGRAICCFFDRDFFIPGIIRSTDDIPNPARSMAKTSGRAQYLRISEFQARAIKHDSFITIERVTCGLRPVEVDFEMRSVAKRFVVRLPTTA